MNWFRKKPKASEALPPKSVSATAVSLREFVYLDEVSVYSLTSAPDRPPPVTMSESATTTSGEVATGNVEAGSSALAKVSVGGELNSSRTGGKEVQRQFNIQSQFARLHHTYSSTFVLAAGSPPKYTKGEKRTDDLARALEHLEEGRRAVREADLTRGALAEMRVTLGPHHLFDITAFTKTAGNLMRKYPSLFDDNSISEVATGLEAGEFFSELMEDLVPIEGLATNYRVLRDQIGDRWIADTATLEAVYSGVPIPSEALRVVGVAESDSFWKDTRRILHSDSDYDLLGRIARAGLQSDWTPVKVVDTFRRVIPSAADGLIEAVDSMRNIARDEKSNTDPGVVLLLAGTTFHQALAQHHRITAPGPSVSTLGALLEVDGSLKGTLTGLSRIADDFYGQNHELERDADAVASLRQDAWREAQAFTGLPIEPLDLPAETAPDCPAVELEFIAMYW